MRRARGRFRYERPATVFWRAMRLEDGWEAAIPEVYDLGAISLEHVLESVVWQAEMP